MNYLESRSARRTYDNCGLKEVSISVITQGRPGYFSDVTATAKCPREQDMQTGTYEVNNNNIVKNDAKASTNARQLLARLVASNMCVECPYRGASDAFEVEEIRQAQATSDADLARAREATAGAQLDALNSELGALTAADTLKQAQQQPRPDQP